MKPEEDYVEHDQDYDFLTSNDLVGMEDDAVVDEHYESPKELLQNYL